MVLWLGDYVIYWLNHKPDLSEIIEFTVPVLILLIISSAYAEANGEGQNMIRVGSCTFNSQYRKIVPYFFGYKTEFFSSKTISKI